MTAPDRLQTAGGDTGYYALTRAADASRLQRLPYVVRIFLENVLRMQGKGADPEHLAALTAWPDSPDVEFPFFPGRVILQDFTGVPVVADLAAMRGAVARV